jgi:predicted ArsR family transcriptional regulator
MSRSPGRDAVDASIESVAALADPVRRNLYRFVVSQPDGAGREAAAANAGISRALAAFHLDRLVAEGLLEVGFRRLGARRGPGAGRPAKIYRRAEREIAINLPERHYEVAGDLLAAALDGSAATGPGAVRSPDPTERLDEAARTLGHGLGVEARKRAGSRPSRSRLLDAAIEVLGERGYEPLAAADGTIVLRNCPFDALAELHRPLICGMNFSIMGGIVEGLRAHGIVTVLDPQPGRCCVLWGPAGT